MRTFTNPLDNIRVASPCKANWDEMFGNDRKRHCGECKLNVYNLSNMTRLEAENLLINSEGRLCVRFYRRADGTVLTKNCPVGWQAVKRRVSRVATAAVSMIAGLFTGVLAFDIQRRASMLDVNDVMIENKLIPVFPVVDELEQGVYIVGAIPNIVPRTVKLKKNQNQKGRSK